MRLTGEIALTADAPREVLVATLVQGLNEALARLDDERTALARVRIALETSTEGLSLTLEADRVRSSLPVVTGREFKAQRRLDRTMRRALR